MDMNVLVRNIERRLEELGLTATEVSRRATGSADTIRNWQRSAAKGSTTGATVRTLEPIARVLGLTVPQLVGIENTESVDAVSGPVPILSASVPFGGKVGAGGFLPVLEYFNQDDENRTVPQTAVRHPAYPTIPQFAWLVEGDSMTEANILDGMWVIAGTYSDYVDRVGDVDNGQYVIVERTRFGGSERELTLKEVQFTRGGMRLIPRSLNLRHKELFIPLDHKADGDEETVRILAVVLAAVMDFGTRRHPT
jgi:SOS-response transcriptional repressor LexA